MGHCAVHLPAQLWVQGVGPVVGVCRGRTALQAAAWGTLLLLLLRAMLWVTCAQCTRVLASIQTSYIDFVGVLNVPVCVQAWPVALCL